MLSETQNIGSALDALPEAATLFSLARKRVQSPAVSYRVALLADTSTQILAKALVGMGHFRGYEVELFEAEFDQIDLQVLNPGSELHAFAPETVLIYLAGERFADKFSAIPPEARHDAAEKFIDRVGRLSEALSAKGYQTICFNLADPGDGVFGNYASKVRGSLGYQLRTINYELMRMAEQRADFHVYELDRAQAQYGRAALQDSRLYCTSKMPLTPDACRFVARDILEMLAARKGGGRKCIILDLDNTLWGGVIGDDGVDRIQIGDLGLGPAFSRLQGWLKQLKERGIVLAVCSKNDDAVAREPFLRHPEMKLRLADIAVFVANWKDKATNIRSITEIIDVDYSSIVFLDDNPAERALVRESFPAMTVPELPADPCEYLPYLQSLNLFETAGFTVSDRGRTESYQAELQRRSERENFVDQGDFLKSLEMKGAVREFTPYFYPRIAQLTQRSNQFNLRTVRYAESDIGTLAESPEHRTLAVELSDRFGDYGLISVVVLQRQEDAYFVDTWLMSCRVLGRGVEAFVLNQIATLARADGVARVVGEYIATARNGMVAGHYPALGFQPIAANRWELDLRTFELRPNHIESTVEYGALRPYGNGWREPPQN